MQNHEGQSIGTTKQLLTGWGLHIGVMALRRKGHLYRPALDTGPPSNFAQVKAASIQAHSIFTGLWWNVIASLMKD